MILGSQLRDERQRLCDITNNGRRGLHVANNRPNRGLVRLEAGCLYSIAFGLKICDRRHVLAEAFRVLRPGGVFLSLEAARIPVDWLHSLYLGYMDWCLPLIARIATGGDRSSYDYVLRGIHEFPAPSEFAREIASHGFTAVSYQRLTLGIVALHRAVRP